MTLGAVADIHVDIGAVTSRINVFDTATIEADQEQASRVFVNACRCSASCVC